jgi:hypothetical protein
MTEADGRRSDCDLGGSGGGSHAARFAAAVLATINNQTTTNSRTTPSTKRELVAANFKLLIEQLEVGHSDALTNYLAAMSRFHNYSFLCCD